MRLPSVQDLVRGAELETGHSDWTMEFTGTPFEALEILVGDLNQAGLSVLGARRMYRRIH